LEVCKNYNPINAIHRLIYSLAFMVPLNGFI
jgi:hypothetical protein